MHVCALAIVDTERSLICYRRFDNQMHMTQTPSVVDLSNCDQEPIHIPGAIQSVGLLFALDHEGKVLQVSTNSMQWIERTAQELCGVPLSSVLGDVAIPLPNVSSAPEERRRSQSRSIVLNNEDFDVRVHRNNDSVTIVELERRLSEAGNTGDLHEAITRLADAESIGELADETATCLRQFTGYDRSMVYQFQPDDSGEVIAESRLERLESFLGLRYPASDIPRQARALYIRNRVRQIGDVEAVSIPILPQENPQTGMALDLSDCVLRAVSPIHIQYLQNMGVGATLCGAIVVGGRLWGIALCHHYAPRWSPHETRSGLDFLCKLLATRIETLEARRFRRRLEAVHELQSDMVAIFKDRSGSENWGEIEHVPNLLQLIDADGVAVLVDGQLWTLGQTPKDRYVHALAQWLIGQTDEPIFYTDRLRELYTESEDFVHDAAGVLAIPIQSSDIGYAIWFRREQVMNVTWAGDPNKPVIVREGNLELTPRKSFELWKETVHGRSRSWQSWELELAAVLGEALASTVSGMGRIVRASNEAWHNSEQRFDLAVRGSNDGIWDWPDVDRNQQWWSSRFFELLEYQPGEIDPSIDTLRSLIHIDDRMATLAAMQSCVHGNGPIDVQCRLQTKSGNHRWFHCRGDTAPNQSGSIKRIAGAITDIHTRKLAEQQLRVANQDLARKNEQLQRFAFVASHDLQEPLRMVSSYAELFRKRYEDQVDERADKYIQYMVEGSERMAARIKSLLDYSRIGVAATSRQSVDSRKSIERALQSLDEATKKQKATIEFDTPMPTVWADEEDIERLFQNLLSNAIKFHGTNAPQVNISAVREGSFWLFTVKDNGIGIEPEYFNRIFEVFQRLHNDKKIPGTGIGLAICQRIIEKYGGRIRVESELGFGSCFLFTLPAERETKQ